MDKKLLAVIATGLLVLFIGCIGEERPTAEQVRDRSLSAMEKVETYAVDTDISMLMGGTETDMMGAQEMRMDIQGSGKIDKKNKRMHMETTMSMFGMAMNMDQYIIGDTQYIEVPMFGWVKNKTPIDVWAVQSESDLMRDAESKLLEDEKVDGRDCYVLEMKPDAEKIFNVIGQQMGSMPTLTPEDLESIQDIKLKGWIAKGDYLVMRMLMDLQMKRENATMNMNMTVRFYDYGKPMEIILPEEAENAKDMESLMEGITLSE